MNELAVRTELDALAIANQIDQLRGLGETLVKSGLLPASIKTAEAAVVIILKGRELGIPPMEALNSINVIQGKPTVSPQLMLALIYRSGQGSIQIIERSDARSVVRAYRKGLPPQEFTFTLDDARRLGLAEKDNYRKQPAVMLQWRNVAAAARAVFPDVISGLYLPEEMGAEVVVDDEGNMTVIETSPTPTAPQATPAEVLEGEIVEPQPQPITEPQIKKIAVLLREIGADKDRALSRQFCGLLLGREVSSIKELSKAEASELIELLSAPTAGETWGDFLASQEFPPMEAS